LIGPFVAARGRTAHPVRSGYPPLITPRPDPIRPSNPARDLSIPGSGLSHPDIRSRLSCLKKSLLESIAHTKLRRSCIFPRRRRQRKKRGPSMSLTSHRGRVGQTNTPAPCIPHSAVGT
jgi:hypothetical protein